MNSPHGPEKRKALEESGSGKKELQLLHQEIVRHGQKPAEWPSRAEPTNTPLLDLLAKTINKYLSIRTSEHLKIFENMIKTEPGMVVCAFNPST